MQQEELHSDYLRKPKLLPHLAADTWGKDKRGWWVAITINDVSQIFRWIVPGDFMMGSPPDEPGRFRWETKHSVTITEGYWLANTACTQALWESVMGTNPAYFKEHKENPVEQVSWEDVTQDFIPKLKELTGLSMRLPTEAEWEYACRAGTTTAFHFGKNITTDQVNFDANHPQQTRNSSYCRNKTVPVTSMSSSNLWGLYEMHGNVWEWCQDWYSEYEISKDKNPSGPASGTDRVLRGGSWLFHSKDVRSAFRDGYSPSYRSNLIGFRLVLTQ